MSMETTPPPPKTAEECSEKPLDLSYHPETPKTNGFCKTGKSLHKRIYHPYQIPRDEDVIFLSRASAEDDEYSPPSPKYSPSSPSPPSPEYPPSSPSLPDIMSIRTTPAPDPQASFPSYNLIKTYFNSNFVQYIPQNDFGMGFPKYITYK
ncbi:hypothetical protein TNCT_567891 [Trichonephila clavata]|uniref:Uncharacterized protein n=1 Tax=Trichonephila clavata TaxID=2740835 RepID=A0A8X6FDW7_TRICU|nr:hypothetical protein TNCT_567891 [Trichonephila clavata]